MELIIFVGRRYSATITGYYFTASVQECIKRNKQREGKARVPGVAIYVTAKKMQPPIRTEGFDTLYHVSFEGPVTSFTD